MGEFYVSMELASKVMHEISSAYDMCLGFISISKSDFYNQAWYNSLYVSFLNQ